MAGEAKSTDKPEGKDVKTGFVELEFTSDFGSRKKGDTATYHASTADALVKKRKVAKITKELTKFVPANAEK